MRDLSNTLYIKPPQKPQPSGLGKGDPAKDSAACFVVSLWLVGSVAMVPTNRCLPRSLLISRFRHVDRTIPAVFM